MSSIWSNLLSMLLKGENMVSKLKKVIYGLKQSLRAWFKKFSRIVTEGGIQKCHSHHSVSIHYGSSSSVILVVYVDILLAGSDVDGIERPKTILRHICDGRHGETSTMIHRCGKIASAPVPDTNRARICARHVHDTCRARSSLV